MVMVMMMMMMISGLFIAGFRLLADCRKSAENAK